jgi:hypothetical protein
MAVAQGVVTGIDVAAAFADASELIVNGAAVQTAGQGFNLADFLTRTLQLAARSAMSVPQTATGVVNNDSADCPLGGTIATSWNDANDNDEVDSADTLSATLNACELDADVVANGTVGVTAPTITGDFGTPVCPCNASGTFSVNVTVNDAGETFTVSGGAELTVSSADGVNINGFFNNASLTAFGYTLSNFEAIYSHNDSTEDSSYGVNGTVAGPLIGGSVTVVGLDLPSSMFVSMGDDMGENNPHTGRMEIRGVGSCLEFTAVSNTTVELQLHSNETCTSPSGAPTNVLWEDLFV